MSEIISVKVDVTKIDKARLFNGKNGAKYLDLVLIPTANSKYGDTHVCVQSVTKEERLAGKKGPILGNAKIMGSGGGEQSDNRPARRPAAPASQENLDQEVPF